VQWHPEVMAPVNRTQRRLFDAFVAAARAYEGTPEGSASAATA
jgi:gamma-glutamyl-gamma-aminobutyrate hydrolase PuuD